MAALFFHLLCLEIHRVQKRRIPCGYRPDGHEVYAGMVWPFDMLCPVAGLTDKCQKAWGRRALGVGVEGGRGCQAEH